jgi:hypothetical protein
VRLHVEHDDRLLLGGVGAGDDRTIASISLRFTGSDSYYRYGDGTKPGRGSGAQSARYGSLTLRHTRSARLGNRPFDADGHGSTGGTLVTLGVEPPNPQIMRSTPVRNTRLTSNDASRGCQERTRGTESSMDSGPHHEASPWLQGLPSVRVRGWEPPGVSPSISPIMRSTAAVVSNSCCQLGNLHRSVSRGESSSA